MSEASQTLRVSEQPAQQPASPSTPAQARARFFNSGNAFNVKLPPVPDMVFTDQPQAALDASSPTGMYPCDISEALACDFPATTPLVLASYARICAGESLDDSPRASGVIAYVIEGAGTTHCENEIIEWSAGDIMLFPGGSKQSHRAGDADAVLWVVSNAPQLAFEGVDEDAWRPVAELAGLPTIAVQAVMLTHAFATMTGDESVPPGKPLFTQRAGRRFIRYDGP